MLTAKDCHSCYDLSRNTSPRFFLGEHFAFWAMPIPLDNRCKRQDAHGGSAPAGRVRESEGSAPKVRGVPALPRVKPSPGMPKGNEPSFVAMNQRASLDSRRPGS